MTEPHVIIVNPNERMGDHIVSAFAAKGCRSVVVRTGDGPEVPVSHPQGDVVAEYGYHPGLTEELRRYRPVGVVPDHESAVEVADILANALTPSRANDLARSAARRDKGLMYEAVAAAGLAVPVSIHTGDADAVVQWIDDKGLNDSALVVKPARSFLTDNVNFVEPGGDWRTPFAALLGTTNALNERNDRLMVSERLTGVEYGVETVSRDGVHTLCALGRYTTSTINGRPAMKDRIDFEAFDPVVNKELVDFTFAALDALGIRWGAAHTEVMRTAAGVRLIECAARRCGAPHQQLSQLATGSSQHARLAELYVDGDVSTTRYQLHRPTAITFIYSPGTGVLRNAEVLDELPALPAYGFSLFPHRSGDEVVQSVNYGNVLGCVAFSGDAGSLAEGHRKVRELESQLVVTAV